MPLEQTKDSTDIVMAYTVLAYIVMAYQQWHGYSYGLYSDGLYSDGIPKMARIWLWPIQ